MQRLIFSLAATIILAAGISSATYAQQYESTPVTISSEKVKINGQVCYSHIVLEKQTLYSICKAYNVTAEDLYKYNPSLKEKGLQKNSILIIPIVEMSENKTQINDLSKQKVTDEAAQEKPAQEVVRTEKASEEPIADDDSQKIHVVKWFEDIHMIARKYGVSVESIIKANGLSTEKLSKKQKLVIPNNDDAISETESEEVAVREQADTVQIADSSDRYADITEDQLSIRKEVNMSLLLPLKVTGTSGSTGNMDFYSGVLLAVYDMGKSGTSCDLNVHDTGHGDLDISDSILRNSDVILGPVSAAELKSVLEMEPEAKAVVSPLDQKAASLAGEFANMIQAPTSLDLQYKDLVNWIGEDMQYSDRFIVITEKGGNQSEATVQMKAAADSSGMEYKHLSYSILEGRNVTSSLEYIMTESGTNRVYIASDSEAFVNDVVRNLNLMIYKKYDVVLYAPSRIRNYETIEVENFHNASLHVSTGYYIDYDDAKVQEFLLKYRALFNAEPSQFAFQGYDLAKYFMGLATRYGKNWTLKLEKSDASMLQSTYKFRKSGDGGYVNTGIRRIIYEDDWTILRVK